MDPDLTDAQWLALERIAARKQFGLSNFAGEGYRSNTGLVLLRHGLVSCKTSMHKAHPHGVWRVDNLAKRNNQTVVEMVCTVTPAGIALLASRRAARPNSGLTLVPHGTLNGAGMYRTDDGRYAVSSERRGADYRVHRKPHRVWTAVDLQQRDPNMPKYNLEVARATSLTKVKLKLEKVIATGDGRTTSRET